MVHHKTLKCIQLLCCFIIFLLFLLFHCCWPEQSKQDGQADAERLVWPHRMIGNTSLKNQWSKANARKWLQLKLQCEQVGQVPSESLKLFSAMFETSARLVCACGHPSFSESFFTAVWKCLYASVCCSWGPPSCPCPLRLGPAFDALSLRTRFSTCS